MARLASEAKMGFYPTDTRTIKKVIDKTITFKEDRETVALDCCCGDGTAIDFISREYGCKAYAVELNENRAKAALSKNIEVCLNANALNGVRKNNFWVGLNFLNPPYDINSEGERTEIEFVKKWGSTTAVGGVLILVINPSSADDKMARELRNLSYHPVASLYDPENEDYKNYKQFFMVFVRMGINHRDRTSLFLDYFEHPKNIQTFEAKKKVEVRTGGKPKVFKEIKIPRWKIEEFTKKSNLKEEFYKSLAKASFARTSIEHPNDGQAALLIASGALNKDVQLKNGDRVILKGTAIKERQEEANEMKNNGEITSFKITESFKTILYGLNLTKKEFVKYE